MQQGLWGAMQCPATRTMVVMDDSSALDRTIRVLSEQERTELIEMVSGWRLVGEGTRADCQRASG